ncbi:hemerythrin domain-containing protein [Metallosphaera javensis (ex Sakai et al. 2022)]|uniref:hemerythrin domain-containing protein n=1 Tax=Metallosphaera javensis (ex Sakai et al. 2022) TaxID=2775498 RepID=UPI0025852184
MQDVETISLFMTRDHVKGDDELEEVLAQIRRDEWEKARDKVKVANARIKTHIYLEEEILFPHLKGPDLENWISELMMQHVAIWNLLDVILGLLEERNREIEGRLILLMQLLKAHNSIEEHSIYHELDKELAWNPDILYELRDSILPSHWKPKYM